MAPALGRTPLAWMCHETFLYKWLLIKSLAASRGPWHRVCWFHFFQIQRRGFSNRLSAWQGQQRTMK